MNRMRAVLSTLLIVFVVLGAAQLVGHAGDDEPMPIGIFIILAKIQAGMPVSDEDHKQLEDYALRHANEPVDGVTFEEVMAIVKRVQEKKERPTSDERSKMQKWASGMKERKKQLLDDAQKLSKALTAAVGSRARSDDPKKPNAKVTFFVDTLSTKTEDGDGYHADERVQTHFEVAFPATVRVTDGDDWKLHWDDSIAAAAKTNVSGTYHYEHHLVQKSAAESKRIELEGTVPIELPSGPVGGTMTMGDVDVPKGGARPYLKVTALCAGAQKSFTQRTHIHRSRQVPHDEDNEQSVTIPAVVPAPLSLDDYAPGSPFSIAAQVPEAYRKAVLNGITPELAEAAKNAKCSFDAADFQKKLALPNPFDEPLDYSYVSTKAEEHGGVKTKAVMDVKVRVTIHVGEEPKAELVITPSDPKLYDAWLPVPYTKDAKIAKAFRVNPEDESVLLGMVVSFASKEDGGTIEKGRIKIDLQDVSENPGICTNYPIHSADTPKGLFFPPNQPGLTVSASGQSAETENEVESITIKIAARESGAWGHLVASCPGRESHAVWYRTHAEAAPIPDDVTGNHISCSWGWSSHAATWDEDPFPFGQACDGDGYTLYEEYRGFIVLENPRDPNSWVHIRTDPAKKDVFVFDRDHIFQENYFPENPSGLTWHYVDEQLMKFSGIPDDPDNRWVNVNTPPGLRYARQYGLYVIRDNTFEEACKEPDPDKPGETRDVIRNGKVVTHPVPGETTKVPGVEIPWFNPLRDQYQSVINFNGPDYELGLHSSFYKTQGKDPEFDTKYFLKSRKNYNKNTVIHEVGHFLGIHHHWPEGADIHDPGVDDSSSQRVGVCDCAMRYANKVWDGDYVVTNHIAWPCYVRYCREDDDAFSDTDRKKVQHSNNCWHQIKVKSDPK